jgi:multidrug resistance efflux pump
MKTIETEPNLLQEAQRAADSAPSRAALAEATAKLESLRLQRNKASAVLEALEKEASVGAAEMIERAKALIKKGEVPSLITPDELRQARQALRTIEGAIQIQERDSQSVMFSVCGEVRRNLRPCRQRIIVRIAAALRQLEAAAKEEDEVLSVVNRAGVNVALVGYLQIPDLGGAKAWLSACKSEGYEF